MAELYEYYNTGDDVAAGGYLNHWRAQTFTPQVAHKIASVKLKLYRTGSPGTVTVGIRATDVDGHPTGADLCSGTTNGNTLTTDTAGEWRGITLGAGYNLSASTKYAIVVRATSGDIDNRFYWRADNSSPSYSGGNHEYSSNSGSSWDTVTTADCMFEEWGAVVQTTTATLSALFKAIDSSAANLDVRFKAIDTETPALDVLFADRFSTSADLDTRLVDRFSQTVDISALFKGSSSQTPTLTALFQAMGVTSLAELDVLFKTVGDATADLDTHLVDRLTQTPTLDALLKGLNIALTASLDANIAERLASLLSIDVIFGEPVDIRGPRLGERPTHYGRVIHKGGC